MTKKQMLEAVDRLYIYEEDFKTINKLMDSLEDSLFVKIIEEILEGNLFFSDFENIFKDEAYSLTLKNNLESQNRLKIEIERTLAFRKKLEGDQFSIDPTTTRIGITVPSEGTDMRSFYNEIKIENIKNQVYSLFEMLPNDNETVKAAKLRIYNAFQNNEISEEDFLLFARDFILPISIEGQLLDISDLKFMTENKLTEDQMKKIKAFSYFLRREDRGGE
jgi:hypothetical protein